MSKEHLIPPGQLIIDNEIGSTDRFDMEKVRQEFVQVGQAIAKGLINQASLSEDSSVLDVGCGLGRVAVGLLDFLAKSGSYTGLDIVPSSISWCQSAFAAHPNFRFVHADVFSKFYNQQGSQPAEKYKFPFADDSFDFVFSMSLFTHLMIEASDNYLGEISRVAKPGACVVNTFFILDEISTPLAAAFHRVPGGAVQTLEAPEAVSALNLDQLKEIHRKHGLEIEGLGFGFWSGRPDANPASYQDAIRARKKQKTII